MSHGIEAIAEKSAPTNRAIFLDHKDAPPHILIADDNETSRSALASVLHDMGCRLEVAENGKEAVGSWERSNFDLILMDVDMPFVNGFEATWIIRDFEKDRGDYTPIIACSADRPIEDIGEFISVGFDGFVRRPLLLYTLQQEIERCMQLKRPSAPCG